MKQQRHGFTFVEMIMVVVIIAILALIVIPKLMYVGKDAKEASLKGYLHILRNGISQFEADCGDYPADLHQLQSKPMAGTLGGNGRTLDIKEWCGPYLRTDLYGSELPIDPFTGGPDWCYEPTTGFVHSASGLTASDGTKYHNW